MRTTWYIWALPVRCDVSIFTQKNGWVASDSHPNLGLAVAAQSCGHLGTVGLADPSSHQFPYQLWIAALAAMASRPSTNGQVADGSAAFASFQHPQLPIFRQLQQMCQLLTL